MPDARHARVHRKRGRASDYTCEHCGSAAHDWATIHGMSGETPEDYMPLCRPCHMKYDGIHAIGGLALAGTRKSPEMRAKVSASKMGHPVSAETRAKLSAAALKQWERIRSG